VHACIQPSLSPVHAPPAPPITAAAALPPIHRLCNPLNTPIIAAQIHEHGGIAPEVSNKLSATDHIGALKRFLGSAAKGKVREQLGGWATGHGGAPQPNTCAVLG